MLGRKRKKGYCDWNCNSYEIKEPRARLKEENVKERQSPTGNSYLQWKEPVACEGGNIAAKHFLVYSLRKIKLLIK